MRVIDIKDLNFRYAGSEGPALRGIDLSIEGGEFVTIVGPTGCGKSSLLRCINGLIPNMYSGDYSGSVNVLGMDAASTPTYVISQYVGMVFQNPDNQLFALSVEADVAFALENIGLPREEIGRRVEEALKSVGIEDLRNRSPFELSGGQKQRVAIASVLALEPRILLLDEPTSSLDPLAAKSLIELLASLKRIKNMTILVVEHRLDFLIPYTDRLIVMREGRIYDMGHPREVLMRVEGEEGWFPMPKLVSVWKALGKRVKQVGEPPLTSEEVKRSVLARMGR